LGWQWLHHHLGGRHKKENHGLDPADVSKLEKQLHIQHTMILFVEVINNMPQHQNKAPQILQPLTTQ
jgi:hypothetical protein